MHGVNFKKLAKFKSNSQSGSDLQGKAMMGSNKNKTGLMKRKVKCLCLQYANLNTKFNILLLMERSKQEGGGRGGCEQQYAPRPAGHEGLCFSEPPSPNSFFSSSASSSELENHHFIISTLQFSYHHGHHEVCHTPN